MTIPRMVGLLVGLALLGVAVVAMRVDQARMSWKIQEMQFQKMRMDREAWSQEIELARLRSPDAVRERAIQLGIMPEPKSTTAQPTRRR